MKQQDKEMIRDTFHAQYGLPFGKKMSCAVCPRLPGKAGLCEPCIISPALLSHTHLPSTLLFLPFTYRHSQAFQAMCPCEAFLLVASSTNPLRWHFPLSYILSFELVNSSGYAAFKQRLSLLATGGSPDQWMQDIKVTEGSW